MGRWTVLLGLLIFYGNTSSQPVTDESENARQARQLDFGECCPCPGSKGFAAQEDMLARSRNIDDCPCRPRSSDSEGASSIFFPSSRRSDDFIRPADKREDIKPLLHPEVDLASSVLQTIREATEEEYEDALARDAARSMAKAAEETMFGDAMPEASNGNIVTIIVNPKHNDSFEDEEAESHVQQSHCIHPPFESASPNLGQMQVAHKPPIQLREIFGLPRINKPSGLLRKNLLDMDNGASNIQERVINIDDSKLTNKSILGSRKYAPSMKFDTKMKDISTNLKGKVNIDTNSKKIPDFKLPPFKKLKDLLPNRPTLEDKEKSNSLPLIPKMRFNNPLLKVKGKEIEDLSLSPSNIHEQAKKSFFQTKSHLENLLQNTKPVGLKTLLKLKDVEFVPLKDLIPKAAERPILTKPKFTWPRIFNKGDKGKSLMNIDRSTEIIEQIPKSNRDDALDAEVSPSNIIDQINDNNCMNSAFKTTETDAKGIEAMTVLSDTMNTTSSLSKDLIPKAAEKPTIKKPKFPRLNILNKGDKVKNPINIARHTEILEKIPHTSKDATLDAEVSPSNVIEQINDENCVYTPSKTTETDYVDTEVKTDLSDSIDAASSPSEIQEIVNDTSNDIVTSQSNELTDNTDDCNIKTSPQIENNFPQSMDISFENEAQANNEDELNFETSKENTRGDVIAGEDSESEFVSNAEDCVNNTNDGDSITDSSNNLVDVLNSTDAVLENVDDSLINQTSEAPCSEELSASDTSKTLNINPMPLIKPLSLDITLSTIKENIRKHIESLKNPKAKANILEPSTSTNIIGNVESSPITDDKLDSDCQNEESIQVTTVKPNIFNDDSKIVNEPDEDKVSMQDLQKISNEMLQEEQERESKTVNCNEPSQEVTDPNITIQENSAENENIDTEQSANTQNEVIMNPQNIVDINENNNDVQNACQSDIDTEQSANTQNDVIMDPQNIVDINENNNDVQNACKSDLMLPKLSIKQEPDANVEASEVVMSRTPQTLLRNKVLQPNQNDFILNIPLPELPDIKLAPLPTLDEIKFAPLPTLDDIKLGFTNLFDKPEREEEHSALEAASMTDRSNIAPIMSTDASLKHFQSLLPPLRLEDLDLDILQLNPQSNLFPKLDLHSFRTKLPLPTDLRIKPLKLQSAFEDNGGLLGASLSLGHNNPWAMPGLDNLGTRIKANTNKIAKTLGKPDSLKLKSSHGIGSLESKIRGATTRPVNLQNNDFLEAISRNHEDVNDKLRALHIDFNDRLETMRNNLFDKSVFGSGESRSTKSFSTFSTKDKKSKQKTAQPLSSRRESKKVSKPLRQKETRIGSSHGLQNKFKMPASASVPVPRTIQVPELKATLTKSPGLGMQRASGIHPIFQNIEASHPKESTITLWKQASKKLPLTNTRLGKTINPFRDSKINISFSTTPRPILPSRLQSRKLPTSSLTSTLGKNTGRLGQRLDNKGSPSEMRHSIISSPISSNMGEQNLGNYGLKSESRQSTLPTLKLRDRGNLEQPKISKDLQSWPKVSESAFLSKVKEAVKARMSKVNSPVTFKKVDGKTMGGSVIENGVLNSNTDMARSASTNIDVIKDQALKENVSYKCTMLCTKE